MQEFDVWVHQLSGSDEQTIRIIVNDNNAGRCMAELNEQLEF